MVRLDSNHWCTVKESISGTRTVDEQTFASLAVLTERLKWVKRLDKTFEGITFSPDVKKLARQKKAVAV